MTVTQIGKLSVSAKLQQIPSGDCEDFTLNQWQLSTPKFPNLPFSLREEFRAFLGVRKYPKNESSVLWAGAMGISSGGLVW
jgi:hypothetical protein